MVSKRNTLGRGLGSLLNVSENKDESKFFDEIDINDIKINKDQPRIFQWRETKWTIIINKKAWNYSASNRQENKW